MEDVSTNENHSIPSSLSSSRRSEFEIEANMKLEEDISIVKSSLRQLIQMGGDETPSQSSNSGNRSCCNEQERRAMSADCEENDDDEAKPPPIFPKHWNELFAVLPGVLMVILFGYTYAAIVISGNPQLENHAGFLLFWSQISNIAITLSAVLVGSTKWVVGGANTTSAIMLKILLENANIETALFVQGISSLFAAILFIGIANFGGLGRLFGDKNANVALYADYIHLSLVMALSHATALLMMKFALEISVHGDVLKFTGEWFRNLFKSDAISVWVPGLILGGLSAYVDLRLRNQMIAMTILFVLPLALFIGISTSLGLDIIPSHHYWNIKSDAIDTFQNLDFNNNIDFVQIAKKMPLCILGAIVIFIEAQAVYKSFSVVVPERRSIKKDNISCGLAHIVIGCLGGWFGHQTFVESFVNHNMGFRFSYLGGLIETAVFAGFAVMLLSLESIPIPTILLCATLFYLASVFIDIWFLQRLPPHSSKVEWLLSIGILICALIFGFIEGMAIGIAFTSIIVYSTKIYCSIIDNVEKDVENHSMRIQLKGHMSHGNTTEVFDKILDSKTNLKWIDIDISLVNTADSSLGLFLHSVATLSNVEYANITIQHCYEASSNEYSLLDSAATFSKRFDFKSVVE